MEGGWRSSEKSWRKLFKGFQLTVLIVGDVEMLSFKGTAMKAPAGLRCRASSVAFWGP
jgi:hypothetical protein